MVPSPTILKRSLVIIIAIALLSMTGLMNFWIFAVLFLVMVAMFTFVPLGVAWLLSCVPGLRWMWGSTNKELEEFEKECERLDAQQKSESEHEVEGTVSSG